MNNVYLIKETLTYNIVIDGYKIFTISQTQEYLNIHNSNITSVTFANIKSLTGAKFVKF